MLACELSRVDTVVAWDWLGREGSCVYRNGMVLIGGCQWVPVVLWVKNSLNEMPGDF